MSSARVEMFVKQFPPKTLWSIDVFLLKVHIVSNFSKKALAAKIFSFLAHTLLIQNLEKRGQKLPSYYKVIFWESDENQTLVRNATNDAILHVKLLQRMVKIPKWKVTQLHRNCNLSLRETTGALRRRLTFPEGWIYEVPLFKT